MPTRVLLISLNRCTVPDPVFPLGLTCLNAALRAAGHETAWHDRLIDGDDLETAINSFQPAVVGLSLRNIDNVLIRKPEVFFEDLAAIVGRIRATRAVRVVLGGSGFSVFPRLLLERSGADVGVVGEGEAALLALLQAWEEGREPAGIPGLVQRRDGGVVLHPAQPVRHAWPVTAADRPARLVGAYLQRAAMLNVQTQRGCAHTCCYCTYPLLEGAANRRRPAEDVAEDFAQLEAHGARYAFVVDSVFNSTRDHVAAICEALIRRRLTLRWGCFLRPQGLDRELMTLMQRAGLAHVEFGTDSFCDRVLHDYGKRFTFDDVRQAHDAARAAGVDACHFLICGGPGETEATLAETFNHSTQLAGAIIMAVVGMRIYPGTPLERRARREGLLAPDADLLAPSYYIAPGLTTDGVFATLRTFTARAPGWIAGDPAPEYERLVERLRRRGVAGPLWSYFALLQRIQPAPAAAPVPA